MVLRADSERPQRVSGSARTDSRRAESARNPIASHVNFGDDSALNAFTRNQWTAALTVTDYLGISAHGRRHRGGGGGRDRSPEIFSTFNITPAWK